MSRSAYPLHGTMSFDGNKLCQLLGSVFLLFNILVLILNLFKSGIKIPIMSAPMAGVTTGKPYCKCKLCDIENHL